MVFAELSASLSDATSTAMEQVKDNPALATLRSSLEGVLAALPLGDPIFNLFIISVALSFAALIIAAIMLLSRRSTTTMDFPALCERVESLEALLRDQVTARATERTQLRGDIEYVKQDLQSIRSQLQETSELLMRVQRQLEGDEHRRPQLARA